MNKRAIVLKNDSTANLEDLVYDTGLVKRGIKDIDFYYSLEKLKQDMMALFKSGKYDSCIKTCKRIFKINSNIPLVKLIHFAARKRHQKS